MPYETVWEERGVYQRYFGVLAPRDRESGSAEVTGNERFESLKYWIVDSLGMERYTLSSNDAITAAAFDIGAARYNNHMLMVFVVTDMAHRENIQRYMELLKANTNWQSEIFDDIESARQWIAERLA